MKNIKKRKTNHPSKTTNTGKHHVLKSKGYGVVIASTRHKSESSLAEAAFKVKQERMELRLSTEHKNLFIKAAQIKGFENVTDYVRHIVLNDAVEAVETPSWFTLTSAGQQTFFDALTREPVINNRLQKSLKNYLEKTGR